MSENVKERINISRKQIQEIMNENKNLPLPVVPCRASGARSRQATRFRRSNGIECLNDRNWLSLNPDYQTF